MNDIHKNVGARAYVLCVLTAGRKRTRQKACKIFVRTTIFPCKFIEKSKKLKALNTFLDFCYTMGMTCSNVIDEGLQSCSTHPTKAPHSVACSAVACKGLPGIGEVPVGAWDR